MGYEDMTIKFEVGPVSERKTKVPEMPEVFNSPDFATMKEFFIDDREGQFDCVMTLLGNKPITIDTTLQASSLQELENKIENWVNEELEASGRKEFDDEWEVRKFMIDFSFSKDGEEVQAGGRRIIDKN